MSSINGKNRAQQQGDAFICWDMAGTLIPFDPVTGTACSLPGADEFLPELAQNFRLVVTTGDATSNAKSLLSGFDLLNHFEMVLGDLFAPVGKPYGEILRHLGGDPLRSLAVGDRLRADVASDTPDVVTILVNQGDDTVSVGIVNHIILQLNRLGANYPDAFEALCEKSTPNAELVGDRAGGRISAAWDANLGFPLLLLRFSHPVLDSDRLVIQI